MLFDLHFQTDTGKFSDRKKQSRLDIDAPIRHKNHEQNNAQTDGRFDNQNSLYRGHTKSKQVLTRHTASHSIIISN